MEYRILGRTGLRVSEIGLGALEIGRDWGIPVGTDFGRPDEKGAERLLNAALDAGITLIDTAPAYQLSEERIGKAISYRRHEFVLATKVGERLNDGDAKSHYDYSYEATLAFVEQSLRRLQTDVIDVLQIHSASIEVIRAGETLRAMKKMQEQGKVRFVGMTGNVDAAIEAVKTDDYDTVQVSYNVAYREAEHELFPLCLDNNIGVIIKDGLARGSLTPKVSALPEKAKKQKLVADRLISECVAKSLHPNAYPKSLSDFALRFVLHQKAVTSVIAGTRKVEHLLANVGASDGRRLTDAMVRKAIEIVDSVE
ncbi:MAG TPA: aldo/keto reductase [Candidatus Latescibacteria bacterium]|nr:aldo/keto reductase [Candidatus Latescibacterota bacterium]